MEPKGVLTAEWEESALNYPIQTLHYQSYLIVEAISAMLLGADFGEYRTGAVDVWISMFYELNRAMVAAMPVPIRGY